MKRISPVVSLLVCLVVSFAFVSCKKGSGPTDVALLKKVMNSESEKGYMEKVHESHEEAGVECIKCHHKHSNDDRIKVCSNCHAGEDAEAIINDTCIGCHKGDAKE